MASGPTLFLTANGLALGVAVPSGMIRHAARFLALSLALACAGAAHAQSPATWLFTSDVHLNALADPALADRLAAAPVTQWDAIFAADPQPLAGYGADTNDALFRLSLAQMRAADPDPQVVFISGDFLAHDYRKQWDAAATDKSEAAFDAFVDKNIAYLAVAFDATFPHAQFVITLGNNDSPCGDYAVAPHSAFLANFAKAWEPLVDRDGRAPDFARDFPADGDYVAALPNGTRAIAVNSNTWSRSAESTCDPSGSAGEDVMAWFEHAVAAAPSGARTWTVLHVPPGIDAYSSFRKSKAVAFYTKPFLARFRAVRAADGAPLGLIVAGHLHNGGFRIVDRTPLLLVPSISPIHANNPSFFVARIDPTSGAIADYAAYDLDDSPFAPSTVASPRAAAFMPEYDEDAAYGVHGITLAALAQRQTAIHDDERKRALEAAHYVADSPVAAINASSWRAYWCADVAMDPESFDSCLVAP